MPKNSELYHWGIKLGGQSKDHKYYQRINTGTEQKPKYRYFYTQAEYNAYLKSQKLLSSLNAQGRNLRTQFNNTKNEIGKQATNQFNNFAKQLSKAGFELTNRKTENNKNLKIDFSGIKTTLDATKKTADKLVNETKKKVSSKVNKQLKSIDNTIKKGQSFLSFSKVTKVPVSEVIGIKDDYEEAKRNLESSNDELAKRKEKRDAAIETINKELSKFKKEIHEKTDKKVKFLDNFVNAEKAFKNIFKIESKLLVEKYRDFVISDVDNKIQNKEEALNKKYKKDLDAYDKVEKENKELTDIFEKISEVYQKYKQDEKENKESPDLKSLSDLKRKNYTCSPEEDMALINPYYEESQYTSNIDWTNNCAYCTAAYELRRRGYDVEAASALLPSGERRFLAFDDNLASLYGYDEVPGVPDKDGRVSMNILQYNKYFSTTLTVPGFLGFSTQRRVSFDDIEEYALGYKKPENGDKNDYKQIYQNIVMKNAAYMSYYSSTADTDQYELMAKGGINHTTFGNGLLRVDESYFTAEVKKIEKAMLAEGNGARGNLSVDWTGGSAHSIVWEVVGNKVVIRDCQTNDTYDLKTLLERCDRCDYFRTDDKQLSENILQVVRNKNNNYKNDEHDNW